MKTLFRYSSISVFLYFLNCASAEDIFYRRFLDVVGTNRLGSSLLKSPLLIDTNNSQPKLTNAFPVQKLIEQGEVGNIRLGMNMDEVVACLGKPEGLYSKCYGGPRFLYADVSLVFRTNALKKMELSRIQLHKTSTFADGLSSNSHLEDWIRILGEPKHRNGSVLWYETTNTFTRLDTQPDGKISWFSLVVELSSNTVMR
jgi:hypothetical protein